jgi:hypothetical protein
MKSTVRLTSHASIPLSHSCQYPSGGFSIGSRTFGTDIMARDIAEKVRGWRWDVGLERFMAGDRGGIEI